MCLLVFAWDCHPRYRFVFAGNRDEFHSRPARAAQWWEESEMLAGRDEQAGGTWLGIRRDGRFAVVTNFREMTRPRRDTRTRGELITDFMSCRRDFSGELREKMQEYSGFNLIFGDLSSGPLRYVSNRGVADELDGGIHGLSNHLLNTPWPKVTRTLSGLGEQLRRPEIEPRDLLDLLADRRGAGPGDLPDTGLEKKLEYMLSAPFIVSPEYGTRCSTVILYDRNGSVQFVERRFEPDGDIAGESRFEFRLV